MAVTAAGAALGAHQGAIVSNAYLGQIEDFRITKLQDGCGPAVVVIDGFLTQRRNSGSDWRAGLRARHPDNPWYHVAYSTWSRSLPASQNQQTPHVQDEIYLIIRGQGILFHDGEGSLSSQAIFCSWLRGPSIGSGTSARTSPWGGSSMALREAKSPCRA